MENIIASCLPTYQVVGKVGQGLYGSVFHVRDPFKERAVKVVPIMVERSSECLAPHELDARLSRDFHAVRDFYETIKGPGVIEVYDFHLVGGDRDDLRTCAFLVVLMELCRENFNDYVLDRFPLTPSAIRRLLGELAATLHRLENRVKDTFLLTDLKPSNLLINREGKLVIGDLGGLRRLESLSASGSGQFTPNWSAPEFILQGTRPNIAAAVYCFGLVAFFAAEGRLPYPKAGLTERIRRLQDEGVPLTRQSLPTDVHRLIRDCLAFEPADRPPGFQSVMQRLADHPAASRVAAAAPRCQAAGTATDRRAAGTSWREPFTGMIMKWVPPGDFQMGSEEGQANEMPLRKVSLKGFWMAAFPVTQGQWQRVMVDNPSHFCRGSDFPVEQVSWDEAVSFVRRLDQRTGLRFDLALPSEVQWEYAARSGGKRQRYAGGEEPDDRVWYRGNSGYRTHPVGRKLPNDLGIHDMSGNVMEWCQDAYGDRAVDSETRSPQGGRRRDLLRVVRGGAWNQPADSCRTSARAGVRQRLCYTHLGFRIVRNS